MLLLLLFSAENLCSFDFWDQLRVTENHFLYLSPEHVLTATLEPSTPQTSPWYKQCRWKTKTINRQLCMQAGGAGSCNSVRKSHFHNLTLLAGEDDFRAPSAVYHISWYPGASSCLVKDLEKINIGLQLQLYAGAMGCWRKHEKTQLLPQLRVHKTLTGMETPHKTRLLQRFGQRTQRWEQIQRML